MAYLGKYDCFFRYIALETGFLGWDKFQHAFAYGVFTLLAGAGIVCCVMMMGAKK
ncbi:MAG: hypothetical protein Q7I93_04435 [Syntrophales bacterium]|nr:hypothetical protein [Syntrophales bacterium]